MTDAGNIPARRFPILRFSLVLSALISTLYQAINTYIYTESSVMVFLLNLALTVAEGLLYTGGIYYFIRFNNRFAQYFGVFRYPLEWSILLAGGFYLLYLAYCAKTASYLPVHALLKQGPYRLYICINLVGISFSYILITVFSFYQEILDKAARAEQMQQEFARVRLQALKSQVNPHFLFNSLSVLSSLVHSSADMSEKFIIQLSKAYRYILDRKDAELISLREELDFLDAYFFLIQIRFARKVVMTKDVRADADSVFLPPLTLQLLVENAVKHNSMSLAHPLRIDVKAYDDRLEISNNVSRRDRQAASTGIGLDNIRRRIEYLDGGKIAIESNDEFFKVTIPLIKKEAKSIV